MRSLKCEHASIFHLSFTQLDGKVNIHLVMTIIGYKVNLPLIRLDGAEYQIIMISINCDVC